MRFDFRIAVAVGSIVLMLAAVPLMTRPAANDGANTSSLPEARPQTGPVVEVAVPASADEAAPAAPERKVESAPAVVIDMPPAQARTPVTAAKLVSVPLPKARPQRLAADNRGLAAQVASAAKVDVPLPKVRPQSIAADKSGSAAQVVDAPSIDVPLPKMRPQSIAADRANPVTEVASTAKVSVPLPKARPQNIAAAPLQSVVVTLTRAPLPIARPQAIAAAVQPQPAQVADSASQATVVADVPMPKVREQAAAVAEGPPVPQPSADSKIATATPEPATPSGELANASVNFATANPEVASIPGVGELAPSVAEFKPPMPKTRPSNIDRLVLVAEMRKYLGTNPTNRRALWCAAFMNMVLNKLGYKGTRSDAARSFVDYGKRIPGPKIGAIAVLSRGPNGGHVGVVSGVDKRGNPIIVSGNHGHRVGIGTYPRSRVLAYVLPTRSEFKRAAARFSERAQRSSQVKTEQHTSQLTTTQFAARSMPARVENDAADLPVTELLAALAAEQSEGRPGSAALRSRAKHGKPVTSLLAKFLGLRS
jgi:uncharacterized protein (TIGR02594 family)